MGWGEDESHKVLYPILAFTPFSRRETLMWKWFEISSLCVEIYFSLYFPAPAFDFFIVPPHHERLPPWTKSRLKNETALKFMERRKCQLPTVPFGFPSIPRRRMLPYYLLKRLHFFSSEKFLVGALLSIRFLWVFSCVGGKERNIAGDENLLPALFKRKKENRWKSFRSIFIYFIRDFSALEGNQKQEARLDWVWGGRRFVIK